MRERPNPALAPDGFSTLCIKLPSIKNEATKCISSAGPTPYMKKGKRFLHKLKRLINVYETLEPI
jgi:hypothetical protein